MSIDIHGLPWRSFKQERIFKRKARAAGSSHFALCGAPRELRRLNARTHPGAAPGDRLDQADVGPLAAMVVLSKWRTWTMAMGRRAPLAPTEQKKELAEASSNDCLCSNPPEKPWT
ncbi:hypothetical protein [Variovorax sp. PBS-H4]|uniref:hypothetical protein n=1 Tax=Variovorax sp. PBS-H4 TaxID=434008 RepID=UPI0013A5AEE0|nr:hypothetical protein [Variovorax sp. PBS-H4]